ncbi:MAG TPA: hypothetical protein VF606_06520 [Geminicoccaceae bacterium]
MTDPPRKSSTPLVECAITFLLTSAGGRRTAPTLAGGIYRPHLVAEDLPEGRPVSAAHGCVAADDVHIGVAFRDGPSTVELGEEIVAVATILFRPDFAREEFRPGVAFTVREGRRIVGHGTIRRWLP